MKYLVYSLIVFGLTVITHFIFRWLRPMKKVDAVPILAIALFWSGVYALSIISSNSFSKIHATDASFWNTPLFFTSLLLYFLFVTSYFLLHIMTVHESPSIAAVLSIKFHKKASSAELIAEWPDKRLVFPRLEDLVTSGCLLYADGKYHLRPLGQVIVRIVAGYQQLLNLQVGG